MNGDIPTDNIMRIAKLLRLELTDAEAETVRVHLTKQAESFAVLNSVDTDGITPFFGEAQAKFIVERIEQ